MTDPITEGPVSTTSWVQMAGQDGLAEGWRFRSAYDLGPPTAMCLGTPVQARSVVEAVASSVWVSARGSIGRRGSGRDPYVVARRYPAVSACAAVGARHDLEIELGELLRHGLAVDAEIDQLADHLG